MPINHDKLIKELSKGDVHEQIDAFQLIKDFITESLQKHQEEAQETASKLQSTIERINGNS